jgi:hypothetical protein
VRRGFAWIFPGGEDARSFNVGIKLYLSSPHEKPVLANSNPSEGCEEHIVQPSILVSFKRTRGEEAVSIIQDQNVTRRRCARESG